MARVTYGDTVTEYRGSIGGVTYHRNSSGPIVKHKPAFPLNPSDLQSVNQTYLALLVSLWPTLTLSQQEDWNILGRDHLHTTPWGEAKKITGYQWFISNNLNLLATGQPVNIYASAYEQISPPDQFVLSVDPLGIYMSFSPPYSPAVNYIILSMSPPLRQGNVKIRRSLFQTSIVSLPTITTLDLTPFFETYFNVAWPYFFDYSVCFLIARLRCIMEDQGYSSAYTSGIVKVG